MFLTVRSLHLLTTRILLNLVLPRAIGSPTSGRVARKATSMAATNQTNPAQEPDETYRKGCIFCRIAFRKSPGGSDVEHVYSDDKFVAFRDHRPAGKNHFLVIPRAHFHGSVNKLSRRDIPMVREMERIGLSLLDEHASAAAPAGDRMVGFHWPFITVCHLHLHAISPTNAMSLFQKFEYSSALFGSVQDAVNLLEKKADEN